MPNRLKIVSKYKLKTDKFFKNAKQHFFTVNATKKGQKHAKQHFLMPNHFKEGQISEIWH